MWQFGKRIPVSKMSDNVAGLFKQLVRRKYWKQIDPDVIRDIFTNASGDDRAIKSFISISDSCDLVRQSFVKFTRDVSKQHLQGLFAVSLYQLGSAIVKTAISAIEDRDNETLKRCIVPAEMAFASSILCDPYFLPAYLGMAVLYSSVWINKDAALEFCKKYKDTETVLLVTPNEELTPIQQATKGQMQGPTEGEQAIREMAEHAPHLLEKMDLDPSDFRGMRSIIEQIERRLNESPKATETVATAEQGEHTLR